MDKQRKKYLKKLGAKIVQEKSEQFKKIMKESNPLDIDNPKWTKNYKILNQLQKKYDSNRNEVYTKEGEGLNFITQTVEMDLSKQYLPVQSYYLQCKKCGAFVPMDPEISIKCFCDNILFDLESRRKYINLVNVRVVKLVAKISSQSRKVTVYFKNLLNIFKSRKSYKTSVMTSEIDSINALANKLPRENQSNELEARLEKIDVKKLNMLEKESWYHLYGICAFQRNDHQEASKRFFEGLKQFPDCQQIRFSFGQEFIFLNQPEKAFLEFDKCSFPAIPREYLMRMSNYAYLFNEYQRGINYLTQFFPYYFKVKILDDHFLYVRGLPFFSTCLLNYAGHCILSNNSNKLNELFNKVKSECFDYNFNEMAIKLEAYSTGDYQSVITLYISKIDNIKNKNYPTGFLETQIACLSSLTSTSYENAINLLDSIEYTERDHRWLSDMLLLAKACAAHRFNIVKDEEQFKKEFIEKQPFLFEIEHAIAFGLLQYQERLKNLVIPRTT